MRVGFDIGGTFTDIIAVTNDGHIVTRKVLSLLDRVAEDVAMLSRPLMKQESIESFVHGTTIASNAVIEGTAARTGLITTKGFRDDLEMRGQRRPNVYDLNWERIAPLIDRSLRLEVSERVLGSGAVEKPLDEDEVRGVIAQLVAKKVEAIAVCLINSYLNPAHERQIAELIAAEAPHVARCASSEIHPEIKEYERASTTAINAALIPVVDRYLARIERGLAPLSRRILVMQSNGGIMSAAAARRRPAYIIESGPAAGVLAAARLAREVGMERVLSFDMGGTTAKACLIENGSPLEKPGGEIGAGANVGTRLFGGGGHAVRVPAIDIVEAGAGGGSIAWIDDGGALRVGPRSAGADPGPVCYGRGGKEPTVTDANVALGYINPVAIAGSTLLVDRDAALAAIKEKLATPLQLEPLDAAYGVTLVANSAMTRVLRAVSTERGRDPRDFTITAFGGSGPIHAAALAETMEISRLVIPIYPGLFSALGLLIADYRHDYIASIAAHLDAVSAEEITRRYAILEESARAEMAAEGVAAEAIRIERYIDLKYSYQMSEMTLPFIDADPSELTRRLSDLFTEAHQQAYGYHRDDAIELVNLRLRALSSAGRVSFAGLAAKLARNNRDKSVGSEREVYFGPKFGAVTTAVCGRFDIGEERRRGPIIIEEPDTTTVVPPDWMVERDRFANLILTRH